MNGHNIDHARVGLLEQKVHALQVQLDEARRVAAEYETRLKKSTRGTTPQKEQYDMNDKQKKALQALAAAASHALQTFADDTAEPAKAATPPVVETPAPKPAKVKPAPAPAAEAPSAPAAKVDTKPAAPAAPTNGAGDLMKQARDAAKSYAEVYGRDGLVAVLKKYTKGTLADIPAEQLPELVKELS